MLNLQTHCWRWYYRQFFIVFCTDSYPVRGPRATQIRGYFGWSRKKPLGTLFRNAVVLRMKLSEWNLPLTSGILVYLTWRAQAETSGLVEPKYLDRQNTCHRNDDRIARGWQRFSWGKVLCGGKWLTNPNRLDSFQL